MALTLVILQLAGGQQNGDQKEVVKMNERKISPEAAQALKLMRDYLMSTGATMIGLSRLLDVHPCQLSRWLNYHNAPSRVWSKRVIETLGVKKEG